MNDASKLQNTVEIKLWKALTILVTAIIASAGGGIWAGFNSITSDHFTLLAIDKTVAEIKQTYVRQDSFQELCNRIDRLEVKIDRLIERQ
jgi:hypothetical protein